MFRQRIRLEQKKTKTRRKTCSCFNVVKHIEQCFDGLNLPRRLLVGRETLCRQVPLLAEHLPRRDVFGVGRCLLDCLEVGDSSVCQKAAERVGLDIFQLVNGDRDLLPWTRNVLDLNAIATTVDRDFVDVVKLSHGQTVRQSAFIKRAFGCSKLPLE